MQTQPLNGLQTLEKVMEGIFPGPTMAVTIPMKIVAVEKGAIEFEAIASNRHLNPMGGVHGGFAATVLDSATGAAVHTMLEPGESYGTVDLSVKMLRPIPQQKELYAKGRVINMSRHLGISEATLVDKEGKIYAHATSTCMILRKENHGNVISLKSAKENINDNTAYKQELSVNE